MRRIAMSWRAITAACITTGCVIILLLTAPLHVIAQGNSAAARFPSAGSAELRVPSPPVGIGGITDVAFLASLAIPGSGQYALKQNRWVPYAAVETWAWIRYIDQRNTAHRLSRRYKDLAWSIARRVSTGERRDTTFPYYEVLIHYPASGAFDVDPNAPGVQPEFDPATYNGEQWNLAASLFLPAGATGPANYAAAIAYYEAHAIPDAYAFAWNAGRLEQQVYSKAITESDAAYRDATRMLGLILANHLTSAVDALISARLRSTGANLRFESGLSPDALAPLGGRIPPRMAPLRLDAQLRLTW
ncbi:MAG: hypothetical protein ABIV28_08205 [Longimicrobiales bacterium]